MSKFKVGDMVRVTGNTCAHGFENGSNIFIKEVVGGEVVGGYYFAYGINGESWAINDQDLEPAPTTRFKVGETYTSQNGNAYKCINVNEDGSAHLALEARTPAYVWDADGRSLSLSSEWDIVFPPVVETKHHAVTVEGNRLTIVYKVIDGKPDTDNAQLVPF